MLAIKKSNAEKTHMISASTREQERLCGDKYLNDLWQLLLS